jgi:hypothetical protein
MKPKDLMEWAGATTAIALAASIVLCVVRGMLKSGLEGLLPPGAALALLIVLLGAFLASVIVHRVRVPNGDVEFTVLGFTFRGAACSATLWVFVFLSFSGTFLALLKGIS